MSRQIKLTRVRQNNLKNITVEFPAQKMTVITGLSGSGKSSLAFDTLYAEGQRRYIESLSTYTRQFLEKMPKPDLDSIENIYPAIALEQKNHIVNSRSTVGTQTEIVDYLRILFSKVGRTQCVRCNGVVRQLDAQSIVDWAMDWLPNRKALIVAPLQQLGALGADSSEKGSSKKAKRGKIKGVKKNSPAKKKSVQFMKSPSAASLFQLLKEQGFKRVLLKSVIKEASSKFEMIDLEEELSFKNLDLSSFESYVVIDRLRVLDIQDSDLRARIRDSIEQALALGKGRVAFLDLDEQALERWKTFDHRFACVQCGLEHRIPEPQLFSFNSPLGACQKCSGFGFTLDLSENLIVPDPSKTLKNGAIDPFAKPSLAEWQSDLFRFAERHGISIGKRYRDLTPTERKLLWEGDSQDSTFPGVIQCFEELKRWKYKIHIRVFIRRYQTQTLCVECRGARLKPEALAVKISRLSIDQVLTQSIEESLHWIRNLELTANERKIAQESLTQVEKRLAFLDEVGVGYLTLSRLAKTLSGGEYQRINLATQLGNGLCGTLYVLDEPSIGLHAADTARLIRVLHRLRDQGNTVVVVEHDLDVIQSADWLVELGPGAGRRGGEIVATGHLNTLRQTVASPTGRYLREREKKPLSRPVRERAKNWLRLEGCSENNLKNIDVDFPLNRFVVVTGLSGSGKSTLIHKTLFPALGKIFGSYEESEGGVGRFDRLYGAEALGGVVLLDQSPIGKTSRSNPATYLGAWDEVRRLYANQPLALRRGYTPQYFSFNVDGGRCPTCKGEGEITLDMHFMADVRLPCEECDGKRFKKAVLDVAFRGKNIHQLLQTTIDEAFELFQDHPVLPRKLGILREVGLGYLQVGQSATTLSGGESQRLKIAATLDEGSSERLLYLFDEPTTGLHLEDVAKLMLALQDLVSAGHSVILIEHHLDVIRQSDWVIDLGPTGGVKGGSVIAKGTPEDLMDHPESVTGRMLRES